MSLLQTMEGMMTPQLLGRMASTFGVPDSALRGGITSIGSTLMRGLAGKSNDSRTMSTVANLMNESPDEGDDPTLILNENSQARRRGNTLLGLASDDTSGLTNQIGRSLGLGAVSASGLLGTVAAFVMSALRKFGRGRNLSGSSLGSLLRSETSSFTGPTRAAATVAPYGGQAVAHSAAELGVHKSRRGLWLLGLIPLALLAIWLFARNRPAAHETAMIPPEPTVTAPRLEAPPEPSVAARRPEAIPGPRATGLAFPAGSVEAGLLANIRSPGGSSQTWYELDQVNFALNSASLDPASETQVANVAKILKDYPSARIKIGGFTDATGDAESNMKLSSSRAEAVKQSLSEHGIDAGRIEIAAFGEEHKAEATQGSSHENRRVAIQVLSR